MADELSIVKWVPYEAAADLPDCGADAERALIAEIKRHGYKFTGTAYQHGYVPVFSDGTAFLATMRYWGELMAMCWGSNYVDWAWCHPRQYEEKLPPMSEETRALEERNKAANEAREHRDKFCAALGLGDRWR